ncbi:MAG: AsmA family protein [Burkholderiaceae bacterium]
MSQGVKRWLWIGLGAIAVLLAGGAALIATMDLEGFARARLGLVEQATGRSLKVAGALSVRLFPRIVIVAEDVRFANAKWGSQPDMLRVQRLEGVVALIPLLRRQIEIARMELVAPELLLETDAKGTGNWELVTTPAGQPTGSDSSAKAFGISAPSIVVKNGKVVVRGRTGAPLQLAIDSFELAPSSRAGFDQIELKAAWHEQPFAIKGTMGSVARLIAREPKWPLDLVFTVPGTEVKFTGELDRSAAHAAVNGKLAAEIREFAAISRLAGMQLDWPTPTTLTATLAAATAVQRVDPMVLQVGKTAIEGSAAINTGGPRPRITARLTSKDLDLAKPSTGGKSATATATPAASGRVFSDAKLPFAALTRADADIDLRVDRLRLPDGLQLANLNLRAALANGRLIAEPINMNLAQGAVNGRLEVQAAGVPRTTLRFSAKQLSLPALLAQLGRPTQMTGGLTDASTDLALSGDSLRVMAASADGIVRVSIGAAHLTAALALGDVMTALFDAVNPGRATSPGTELRCAVAVLPLRSGVATIDRSIAIETSKFDVIASGTIDLHSEQIDLSLRPIVKQGLGVGTLNLAQFVNLRGPLTHPKVGIGQKEVIAGALSIGAAAATGGLSLLGERLLKQAADPNPCQTALSGKPAAAGKPAEQAAPVDPASILKGLFGKR